MSVPSTGPQSLLDTCSTLSEAETSELRYSLNHKLNTLCWGRSQSH